MAVENGQELAVDESPSPTPSLIERLAEYRIDPSWVEFDRGGPRARGGYGDVCRGTLRNPDPSKPILIVAVKMLMLPMELTVERAKKRLLREASVWATLDHPNVLPFSGYHFDGEKGEAWLVSPWVENGNVVQYLANQQRNENIVFSLIMDTAEGLGYLHSRDPTVIHGDLKGLNVLVNDRIKAVLCDFGLAKGFPDRGLTTTGGFKGSIPWCSPEILDNVLRTRASDMWAWGFLVWEMLTGKLPFDNAKAPAATIMMIIQGKVPKLESEPSLAAYPQLRALLETCWNQAPESRPTIQEALDVLHGSLGNPSASSDELQPVNVEPPMVVPRLQSTQVALQQDRQEYLPTTLPDDVFERLRLGEDFKSLGQAETPGNRDWKTAIDDFGSLSVYTWGTSEDGRLGVANVPQSTTYIGTGVPYPIKVDIRTRIVSLVAGAWCFQALDNLGNIYVWGQLRNRKDGPPQSGFSDPTQQAKTPHRLEINHPNSDRLVRFATISCGCGLSAALDMGGSVWVFMSWGRPTLLTSSLMSSPKDDLDQAIRQVEAGWSFVSMLTQGGDVYVIWPSEEGAAFQKEARTRYGELGKGNSGSANNLAKAANGELVIPCTTIPVSAAPLLLPPIPNDLPDITFETTPSSEGSSAAQTSNDPTKIVQISGAGNFIIGLTNNGHVLYINIADGGAPLPKGSEWLRTQWALQHRAGWRYMPNYSEVIKVTQSSIFSVGKSPKLAPPSRMRITQISAHWNRFVAYSTSASTAPYASLILQGALKSNGFEQTIYPFLDKSIVSVSLGDYHTAALTSSGTVVTWGRYADGALGLGDPSTLPVGAPGGYSEEKHKRMALEGHPVAAPGDVTMPTEINFDRNTNGNGKKVVVSIAASGWHTGALVIDRRHHAVGHEENQDGAAI